MKKKKPHVDHSPYVSTRTVARYIVLEIQIIIEGIAYQTKKIPYICSDIPLVNGC